MEILILCKVVDNFGDIGVVFRLAKNLLRLRPTLKISLVVSDLHSFKAIFPQIDERAENQSAFGMKIFRWNMDKKNALEFFPQIPSVILECFQCGRPDWLEEILFADDFSQKIQIINIDYLTAEDWADDFHLLKSGTRKTNVKKIIFMPGFTKKTGGLLLDSQKIKNSDERFSKDVFKILIFSYERDFSQIVGAISWLSKETRVKVFLAKSKNAAPFLDAFEKSDKSFEVEELPFLSQDDWDSFLYSCDFLFVRGEDSMARACLSGKPFVWHAYVQDENWQLVKVDALLQKIKRHFENESDFNLISRFWKWYNGEKIQENPQKILETILEKSANGKFDSAFKNFAKSLEENGDLAENLFNYIDRIF